MQYYADNGQAYNTIEEFDAVNRSLQARPPQTTPTRTVPANDYVSSINQPKPAMDWQGLLKGYMDQQAAGQKALMDYYNTPQQQVDYSQYLTPLQGPDYSGIQGLVDQQSGVMGQINQQMNTLEDLPDTLRQLYQDTGIQTNQLNRTAAIQSEPITKLLRQLNQTYGVLGNQISQGRQSADQQYNVNSANRANALNVLGLQQGQMDRNQDFRLGGLTAGANMPGQNISLLSQIKSMLTPNLQYSTDPVTGELKGFDPETGQIQNFGQFTTPQGQKLDTQVVTSNGRSLLIDMQTGKTIQDLGAAYRGGGGSGGSGTGDLWGSVENDLFGAEAPTFLEPGSGIVSGPQYDNLLQQAAQYLAQLRSQGQFNDEVYNAVVSQFVGGLRNTKKNVESRLNNLMSKF